MKCLVHECRYCACRWKVWENETVSMMPYCSSCRRCELSLSECTEVETARVVPVAAGRRVEISNELLKQLDQEQNWAHNNDPLYLF